MAQRLLDGRLAEPADSLAILVGALKAVAATGVWDGRGQDAYLARCLRVDESLGVMALHTRDVGHHTSGWWKNPDYERCRHLSLSFFDPETRRPRKRDQGLTRLLLGAFFGPARRWLWCEPPFSPDGRRKDVWHYRLFCDRGWCPLRPRGEVYNRELTGAGWLSYSDLQAALRAQRDGGVLLPIPPPANRP